MTDNLYFNKHEEADTVGWILNKNLEIQNSDSFGTIGKFESFREKK